MKVVIFAALLSLFSTHTFAGCDGFAGESDSLQISLSECDPKGNRIIFAHIQKGKELSPKDFQSYPFKEECENTVTLRCTRLTPRRSRVSATLCL